MNDESPKLKPKLRPSLKVKVKVRKSIPSPNEAAHQFRYRMKDGFADRVKERSLKQYRAGRGKEFELSGSTVIRSLAFVDEHVEQLTVKNSQTGRVSISPVVRLTILAKLLDTSYQTIWRWSSETNQLPEPILTETGHGRELPVYHVEEVRIMIRAIGEHLNEFKYYRKDHTGTRDKLFSQIEEIRLNNYGEPSHGNRQSSGKNTPRQSRPRKVVVRRKVG